MKLFRHLNMDVKLVFPGPKNANKSFNLYINF